MENPYCSCKLTLVMPYSRDPYGEPYCSCKLTRVRADPPAMSQSPDSRSISKHAAGAQATSAFRAAGTKPGRGGDVSHGLQLQSLWIIPTAAVSYHVCAGGGGGGGGGGVRRPAGRGGRWDHRRECHHRRREGGDSRAVPGRVAPPSAVAAAAAAEHAAAARHRAAAVEGAG